MKPSNRDAFESNLIETLRMYAADPVSVVAKRSVLARVTSSVGAGAVSASAGKILSSSSAGPSATTSLGSTALGVSGTAATVGAAGGYLGSVVAALATGFALGLGVLVAVQQLSPAPAPSPEAASLAPRGASTSSLRVAASPANAPQQALPDSGQPSQAQIAVPASDAEMKASRGGTTPSLAPKGGVSDAATQPPHPAQPNAAAERVLLEQARQALANGNGAAAWLKLSQHRRDFPNSALTEEREALAVKALVASAQLERARGQLAGFAARFPRSLFLPALRAAVEPRRELRDDAAVPSPFER